MGTLGDILRYLLTKRREHVVDRKDTVETLATELDKLSDLMSRVLDVTSPAGHIKHEKLPELEILRKQVWNRWVAILGTDGYVSQDPETQEEIEKCVKIAHAAPGAFVEEVYLVQLCLSEGYIRQKTRVRFSKAIGDIGDLTTRMRLNR